MKPAILLTAVFIPLMIAYLAFLAQRDQKLFDAYEAIKIETAKEQYCSQVEVWHPDCKIE